MNAVKKQVKTLAQLRDIIGKLAKINQIPISNHKLNLIHAELKDGTTTYMVKLSYQNISLINIHVTDCLAEQLQLKG